MLRQGITSTAAPSSGPALLQVPSGHAQDGLPGTSSEAILSPEEDRKKVEVMCPVTTDVWMSRGHNYVCGRVLQLNKAVESRSVLHP